MSLLVTEDTPPDMLAGSMDLNVVLPSGQTVKMSVQRGTPMMDLLVQATTAHCLSPGDYSLQAMGDKGVLPFKPSTPIGALDTFTVNIVEKKSHGRGRAPQVPQSFINTFRLQVHLPRSQLFVLRVTPDINLYDIMTHICSEKSLKMEKYEFRNTAKLDEVLELDKTLGYYKVQELSLVSKENRTITGLMSSADIINVKSSKHRQNSVCDSSLSSGSFGSRSGSPVPAINVVVAPPQPPIRKKRKPAPKPPSFAVDKEAKKDKNLGSVLISHSRESSDSSGYHEASVLSESPTHGGPVVVGLDNASPPDTLPRRSKLPSSQSFTNLTSIQPAPKGRLIASVSNTSLNSNGCSRKKRAPPPPSATSLLVTGSQSQKLKEIKMKSSTLPISIAEEIKNGYGSMTRKDFESAKIDDDILRDDASDAKVQIPVENTSRVVNETKASNDEEASVEAEDVGNRVPPKPKPRTFAALLPFAEGTQIITKADTATSTTNASPPADYIPRREVVAVVFHPPDPNSPNRVNEEFGNKIKTKSGKFETNKLLPCKKISNLGKSEVDASPVSKNIDQSDQDSINWEYQLPPPPTGFRDASSPNHTEFGTITITPEVLERVEANSDVINNKSKEKANLSKFADRSVDTKGNKRNEGSGNVAICNDSFYEFREFRSKNNYGPSKSNIMNELTNILNGEGHRKQKEKSLSVGNLYTNDYATEKEGAKKSNNLNHSKSFSRAPVSYYLSSYKEEEDRCKLNHFANRRSEARLSDDDDITYKNYRNMEKSTSLECINKVNRFEHWNSVERDEEKNRKAENEGDIGEMNNFFKKPAAPVQKKLKMAKRSTSSIGAHSRRKVLVENGRQTLDESSWTENTSIDVLRQQFLEFLKEKKLMNSNLEMKSLDVIYNMLPEVVNGSKSSISSKTNNNNLIGNKQPETSLINKNVTSFNVSSNIIVDREINNDKREIQDSEKFDNFNQAHGQYINKRPTEEKVKVIDVKIKDSARLSRHEPKDFSPEKKEIKREESLKEPEQPSNKFKSQEEAVLRREKSAGKLDASKRYSYHGPPSINFSTWGERPKTATKIIIKDEDYVTKDKVTEIKTKPCLGGDSSKPAEKVDAKPNTSCISPKSRNKTVGAPAPAKAKTPEVKKTQIIIKKPGTLSHYEMFSALPKRKEITSLRFFLEEEERNRLSQEEEIKKKQESNGRAAPVVCGIELKEEYKEKEASNSYTSLPNAKSHSLSVYVKGNSNAVEDKEKGGNGFMVPKRNPSLMPVVKGFRSLDDQLARNSGQNVQSFACLGHEEKFGKNFKMKPATVIPPPPPSVTSLKLKSNGFEDCRGKSGTKVSSVDPRIQLLDEIRNFGGLKKLKKSAAY